ncbi:DUF4145 domain-containing protein [Streptomyces goshikiensis]|uniref:DUF4145 domain-containing protein n=1 Tax=Streptomyces goshikiensis TaxID=1942 RepID=UPI003664C924
MREAICPHPECARGVTMTRNSHVIVHPRYVDVGTVGRGGYDPTADLNERISQEIWSCDYCKRTTAELVWWEKPEELRDKDDADMFAMVKRRTIYPEPTPRTLQPEIPERIRSLFDEAARTESAGAVRLAGAGYRAVVEEICKDQGATGRTLYDKITNLDGRLSPDVIDALHEARMVGNDSLHDGLAYSQDELADVAELVTEVVTILYVHPAQRAAMAAARAARRAASKAAQP